MYYTIGFLSQGYFRKRYSKLFVKYKDLLSAALDGGTQVIVFILSFAVFGGSGQARPFPIWAGNNGGFGNKKNVDYCMYNVANAGSTLAHRLSLCVQETEEDNELTRRLMMFSTCIH